MLIYLWCFFGGAFFINSIPHLVSGLCGRGFPTPFAKPPGRGKSSPVVNVVWGALNLAIAYGILCKLSLFEIHAGDQVFAFGLGALILGLLMARHFGEVSGGVFGLTGK